MMEQGNVFQSDRRVFERLSICLNLRLIDLDRSRELEGNTYNLSAKGLGIVSRVSPSWSSYWCITCIRGKRMVSRYVRIRA